MGTIEEDIKEKKARDEDLLVKAETARKTLAACTESIKAKSVEIRDVKAKISQLEQSRGSLYEAYEPQVPALIKNIARDTRFQRRPIGPLGPMFNSKKPNGRRCSRPIWEGN